MEKPKYRSSIDAYKRTDVMTANRETILLMMYAGAIRFLKRAIDANERDDIQERALMIQKTQAIVSELRATLNFDVGGDLAASLEALYAYITERLIQGNLKKDTTLLKEALSLLTTLNSAWEEAIASMRKQSAETASQSAK